MPEQLRHLVHCRAQVTADQEVPRESPRRGRVDDANPVVGSADGELGVARVVEEQRVAAVREEQRDAHVRSGPVSQVRVPQLAAHPEPIELHAALAQTVEVLLTGEREARVDTRATVRRRLHHHPAVRRLVEEQHARGVEEGQPDRRGSGRHLDTEIRRHHSHGLAVVDVDGGAGPVARVDVGRPGIGGFPGELDPEDPRGTDRDRYARRSLPEPQDRSVLLESRRGAELAPQFRPPRVDPFDCARANGGVACPGLTRPSAPRGPASPLHAGVTGHIVAEPDATSGADLRSDGLPDRTATAAARAGFR